MAEEKARRSPALIATAIALPVAVLIGFLVFAVLAQQRHADGQALLRDVAAPASGEPACRGLLDGMPARLGDFERDRAAGPAGYARWQSADHGTVELRCGTVRPEQLTRTSALQIVNRVQWLAVVPTDLAQAGLGSYWVAVDHRPYVTLWIPDNAGTAIIQALSDDIASELTPASLDLG